MPNVFVMGLEAGSGKSEESFLLNKYDALKDKQDYLDISSSLAIAPTNFQCEDITKRFGVKAITIHKFLGIRIVDEATTETGGLRDLGRYKTIVIDELFQNSLVLISRILKRVEENPNIQWIANGDDFQNTNFEILNNVNRNEYIRRILPKYFPFLIVKEVCFRLKTESDRAKLKAIRSALQAGRKPRTIVHEFGLQVLTSLADMKKRGIRRAVTHSNLTAHIVNQDIMPEADYVGMKVMVKTFHKDLTVNKCYTVDKIQKEFYVIKTDAQPDGQAFRRSHFRLPYSLTCHCIQGGTIKEAYAVFDIDSQFIDANWFYTAISRAENFSNLYIYVGPKLTKDCNFSTKLSGYKAQDKDKGRDNNLTYESIIELCKRSNYCCAECGERVEMLYETDDPRQWSIDRINNDIGHMQNNVRLTHFGCNRALGYLGKNIATDEEDGETQDE